MTIPITLVFEDQLSEHVLNRMLDFFDGKYTVTQSYPGNGFGYIKSTIAGFNQAAKVSPFFVLTDLDNNECPVALIEEWLPKRKHERNLIFRVAVREIEAWLIADIEGFSDFSGVSTANFPKDPEQEISPKNTLINIVKRSKKRKIREDIIPINENAKIGPNYNSRLREVVYGEWNIENAITRSKSLKKAMDCLQKFNYQVVQN